MGWACGAPAYTEDYQALEDSALRFMQRHDIPVREPEEPDYGDFNRHRHGGFVEQVEAHISECIESYDDRSYGKYLRRLWHGCAGRALNDPSATGIAWGYIGYEVEA